MASHASTPHASGYPKDYLRAVVVGQGTPSLAGVFQDKPELEVDRTGGAYDGNVYTCWSRFVGAGRATIYVSRSTDSGATFSQPVKLSDGKDVQGCDIAIEHDGDVYAMWGTRETPSSNTVQGLAFARSADGGDTFARAGQVSEFTRYFSSYGARECGDGAFVCPAGFVFFRVPLEPPGDRGPERHAAQRLCDIQRGRPGNRGAEHELVQLGRGEFRFCRARGRIRRPLPRRRPDMVRPGGGFARRAPT